jgi:hypothetical protein
VIRDDLLSDSHMRLVAFVYVVGVIVASVAITLGLKLMGWI